MNKSWQGRAGALSKTSGIERVGWCAFNPFTSFPSIHSPRFTALSEISTSAVFASLKTEQKKGSKMAEEVLVHVAQEVASRMVSLAFDEIGLVLGVNEEVRKLRGTVKRIEALLLDAQEKQVKDRTHKVWLEELKEVAFDIEDLFEDIAYEERRRSIVKNNNKGCYCVSSFLKKPWLHKSVVAHRIKNINQTLVDIDNGKNMFSPVPNHPQMAASSSSSNPVPSNPRETAGFVDVSTVVGRESEKDEIVAMLLGHRSIASSSNVTATHNDFRTVAIIGLGGIGKTTLAQLAYRDDAVRKHFNLIVWICVSDDFNTTNLFTQILQQIPGADKPESSTKQVLQNKLEKELKEKKFLLVLDDVWNEEQEKWDDFVFPLKNFGATGSRVLVTSRNHQVATIVRGQDPCILEGLSDDNCWALIKMQAFMDGEPPNIDNLEEIGKEISKKCKGVPLAAKALGGLLQSMKEESHWKNVEKAKFKNLPGKKYDHVMGVLKYSFDNLSPTLKSCFSYCAIFPKDYWISKKILIQLWMAQGFLKTLGTEYYGNDYFNNLYSKSFFQEAVMNDFGEVTYCKMHDLVQDLAQYICESECKIICDNNETSNSKCRHVSLISTNPLGALKESTKLRTIISLMFNCKLVLSEATTFSDFVELRVLDLSCSGNGKLTHLRYLDLSYTSIKSLPKWVTRLYNLQTLKLRGCDKLIELPEDLKNLKNLRHLFIDEYQKWKKMPLGMGDLVDLQTLPIFVACKKDDGCGILELNKLNNLRGMLDIHRLCLVKDGSVARKANLIGKSNLQELGLHWDRGSSVGGDCNDLYVLEELRPHEKLQRLSLTGFGGDKFPEWVSSGSNLPRLVSMELVDLNYCEHVPSFDKLPRLQSIMMKHMSGVKSIGGVNGASQSSYPLLRKLEVRNLPNLVDWSGDADVQFPSLTSLVLEDVGGMGVVSITSSLTSLTSLYIEKCEDLEYLPKGLLRNNNQLNDVQIERCPKLQALPEGLTDDDVVFVAKSSLRKLKIERCDALKFIPDMRGFTSLQRLVIKECGELETIPKEFLSSLVYLESLSVSRCGKLKGTIELSQSFTRLQELEISRCKNFEGFHDNNLRSEQQLVVLLACCHTLNLHGCPAVRCIYWRVFPSLRRLELHTAAFSHSFPLTEVGVNDLFPSLRELTIEGWDTLQSCLPDQLQHLTMLNSLSIQKFDNLREMPEWLGNLTSLRTLKIRRCDAITSIELRKFSSLRDLEIVYCRGLQSLQGLPFLTALEYLEIGGFSEELDSFPSLDEGVTSNNPLLPSLRQLRIHGWDALRSLPHHLQRLTTLESLSIFEFKNLRELPEWLGDLASLESLWIISCENLRHLPSKEQMQRLTSLEGLSITRCPQLKERCRRRIRDGDGPEWAKIFHIPDVCIDGISPWAISRYDRDFMDFLELPSINR